jgi:PKD repeat protein
MLNQSNIVVPGKRTLWSALLIYLFLSLFSLKALAQGDPYFYMIDAKAGTGGTINPMGNVYVLNNSNITFAIIPDSVSQIKDVEVDRVKIGPVPSYTFENVTSNHTISATFEDRKYVITASAGTGGTITPEGEVIVKRGDDKEFRFKASPGHEILYVLVDNINLGPLQKYKFLDVTSDHTIRVVFSSSLDILELSIPNVAMKIGDVVAATLIVNPPSGIPYTMISGNVGGYPLGDFHPVSENTYVASFTIAEGGNSFTASQNIPVGDVVISDGVQFSSPYNLPIIQENDPIDASLPMIYSMQVSEGLIGIGGEVALSITADSSGYNLSPNSSLNGIDVTAPNISLTESGGGNYTLRYIVQEGDNEVVAGSSEIEASIVLVKPSGNAGMPFTSVSNASQLSIDTHPPVVTRLEVPSQEVGVGGIVRMQVSADGTGYTAGTGTLINGISLSSNRVSLTELENNLYELSYVVAGEDAAVAPGLLEATLLLVDAAGNAGSPYSSIEPNNLEIYTELPTVTLAGPLQICGGKAVELSVFLTGRSPWSFDLYDGTDTTAFTGISTENYLIEVTPVQTTTYQITSLTDVNGVVNANSPSLTITVNEQTEVQIINLAQGYHWEDDPVLLEANIPGGVFSGPGVNSSTGTFDPGLADTVNSPHTIYYTYENAFGCISITSRQVYVWGSERSIFIPGNLVCLNGTPFTATVLNIPGITGSFELLNSDDQPVAGLTDHGDNTASIDPAQLTLDSFTIVFQYENVNTQYLRRSFTVESAAQPLILNLDETAYCQNIIPLDLQSNLENVLFEGPGVTGTINSGFTFNPQEVPPGSIDISCTYISDIGCTATTVISVGILDAPEVKFALSTACAPEGGEIATFENRTTSTSIIESWDWNFGDPSSGGNNQSNLANPTHIYQMPGQVTIGLTATTQEGCIASYELETIVSSQPVADFTWISDCFDQEATVKFINRSSGGTSSLDTILWTFKTKDGIILGEINADPGKDTVSYVFASADSFLVDLYVVSKGGCSNRIAKEILLRPTVHLDRDGYMEDFNNSDGMWSTYSDDQVMSWVWGSPDFNGYSQVPGDYAWYTDLPDGIYGYQENSWIQSPCLDFSGLDRPMIRLDLMKSFVPYIDGAVLQYRDVTEEGWKTVGKSATGIEWYNMEDIIQQPGGSNTGWGLRAFTPDTGWVTAMHDLDQVAGKPNVAIRIAIATGGEHSIGNQGFAFDNVAITPRTKLTVLEHFTNCNDDTSAWADGIIDTLVTLNNEDVIDLQYHVDYRDPDPMNMNNPDPPSTRSFNYGIPKVPYTVLEGGSELFHRYDYSDLNNGTMEEQLRLLTLENPEFDIDLSVDWQPYGLEASTTITCLKDNFDEYLQLYLVVFETEVTAYTGSNGETLFRNVVLDMLPTAAGKLLDYNWYKGTNEVQTFSWTFKPYVEDVDDLAVAAFIQERSTNKILQAAVKYQDLRVGKSDPLSESGSLYIYPNPAHQLIHVNLGYRIENNGRIELFDIHGKVVFEVTIPPASQVIQLDIGQLNNGMYILRWSEAGKVKGMSKVVVIR